MMRAVLVGVVAALPAAALSLTAQSILQELARGGTWGQAWIAAGWTDGEDLEMVPALAASAVFLAFFAAVAAAGVWLAVTRRMTCGEDEEFAGREVNRVWVARWAGVLTAVAVPLLPLLVTNWPLALAAALPAGLVALMAEHWVTHEDVRDVPTAVTAAP